MKASAKRPAAAARGERREGSPGRADSGRWRTQTPHPRPRRVLRGVAWRCQGGARRCPRDTAALFTGLRGLEDAAAAFEQLVGDGLAGPASPASRPRAQRLCTRRRRERSFLPEPRQSARQPARQTAKAQRRAAQGVPERLGQARPAGRPPGRRSSRSGYPCGPAWVGW